MTAYEPRPEHRFTFGLWTVGNAGRDPFGDPTRAGVDPVDSVRMLGRARRVGREPPRQRPRPVRRERRRARPDRRALPRRRRGGRHVRADGDDEPLHAPGLQGRCVHGERPGRPALRIAEDDARDRPRRRARRHDLRLLGRARGQRGHRGQADGGCVRPLPRGAELPLRVRARSGLRPALRARAEAERAAWRFVPGDRRPRADVHRPSRPSRDGRREPRGRPRDDGRTELRPRGRAGDLGRQALPHRPQRAADEPLRPGLPLRAGGPQGGVPARAAARGVGLRRPAPLRRARAARRGRRRRRGRSPAAACAPI